MMYEPPDKPFPGDSELYCPRTGFELTGIYDAFEISLFKTFWAEELLILPISF